MHAHIDISNVERISVETPLHKLNGGGYCRALRIDRPGSPLVLKLFSDHEDMLRLERCPSDPVKDQPFFYNDRRREAASYFLGLDQELVIHRVRFIESGPVKDADRCGWYRGLTIWSDGEGYMQINCFAKSDKSLGLALVSTDAPLAEEVEA